MNLHELLASPVTFIAIVSYVAMIWLAHWLPEHLAKKKRDKRRAKRLEAGLPEDQILNPARALEQVGKEARVSALAVVGALGFYPIIAILTVGLVLARLDPTGEWGVAHLGTDAPVTTLAFAFLLVMSWVLVTATDLVRVFIGGLAFRALVGWEGNIRVGDRLTLKGHTGRVVSIDTFYLVLATADDDTINIPTSSLLGEKLVSINGGDRTSLCSMCFYLHPEVSAQKRQEAEDVIWESIQASPYFECQKPLQILLSQKERCVCLTAKAYVNVTYDEPLFVSDVTRAFLDHAARCDIPLVLWGDRAEESGS